MESSESPLEQAQRHVTEGEQRIAKQKTLIEELKRDGHEDMLPAAHELLAQMQTVQRLGNEHLQREKLEAEGGSQPL